MVVELMGVGDEPVFQRRWHCRLVVATDSVPVYGMEMPFLASLVDEVASLVMLEFEVLLDGAVGVIAAVFEVPYRKSFAAMDQWVGPRPEVVVVAVVVVAFVAEVALIGTGPGIEMVLEVEVVPEEL